MPVEQTVLLLSRLGLGAIATFVAVILWTRTRDPAWMFVVVGVVVAYAETVFSTLEAFGVVRIDQVAGVVSIVARALFAGLPTILITIGLLIVLSRRR